MVSLSNGFSKFPVTMHIPFKKEDIFSDNNFRKSSSDFAGIITDVEGTKEDQFQVKEFFQLKKQETLD